MACDMLDSGYCYGNEHEEEAVRQNGVDRLTPLGIAECVRKGREGKGSAPSVTVMLRASDVRHR